MQDAASWRESSKAHEPEKAGSCSAWQMPSATPHPDARPAPENEGAVPRGSTSVQQCKVRRGGRLLCSPVPQVLALTVLRKAAERRSDSRGLSAASWMALAISGWPLLCAQSVGVRL
mmetsp:Transcript_77704/g.251452  ORF Transcript_77704/g.251452 Transcript_77704/m.251452 type:complete len:117 (+) Transcript_77704:95-445(+)